MFKFSNKIQSIRQAQMLVHDNSNNNNNNKISKVDLPYVSTKFQVRIAFYSEVTTH